MCAIERGGGAFQAAKRLVLARESGATPELWRGITSKMLSTRTFGEGRRSQQNPPSFELLIWRFVFGQPDPVHVIILLPGGLPG